MYKVKRGTDGRFMHERQEQCEPFHQKLTSRASASGTRHVWMLIVNSAKSFRARWEAKIKMSCRRLERERLHPTANVIINNSSSKWYLAEARFRVRRKTALGHVNSHFAAFLKKSKYVWTGFKLEDVHVCHASLAAVFVAQTSRSQLNIGCSALVGRRGRWNTFQGNNFFFFSLTNTWEEEFWV